MQANISEANLSFSFVYFGQRFLYTQGNDDLSGYFSFSQQRMFNLVSENDSIWAANPTLRILPRSQVI